MLLEEHGGLRWHGHRVNLRSCWCSSLGRLIKIVVPLLLGRGRSCRIIFQSVIGLDLERCMLKHLGSVARKLDEVVALEQLFRLRQVWIRVLLHDSRFAVVVSRARVEIAQVLSCVLALAQITNICSHLVILVHELGVEGISIFCGHLIRIFALAAQIH